MLLFAMWVPTLPEFLIAISVLCCITMAGLYWLARKRHGPHHTIIALGIGGVLGLVLALALSFFDSSDSTIRHYWPVFYIAPVIGMFVSWLVLEIMRRSRMARTNNAAKT